MKTISGKETIRSELPDILHDESHYVLGVPERVFFPESVPDIIEALRAARHAGVTVTVSGGRTGITAGSVPAEGCFVISFSAMNRILRVERITDGTPALYCQPGVTLREIGCFLENPGAFPQDVDNSDMVAAGAWCYPPDPTEMTAQLGGTVATNASGARSYAFGATRRHIESLGLVFAGGETATLRRGAARFREGALDLVTDQGTFIRLPQMSFCSPSLKNAAGYFSAQDMDAIDLFIGSEGTLALFSEIGIRLAPAPLFVAGLSFFPCRKEAFRFAGFLRSRGEIAAIEYFDSTALAILNAHRNELPVTIPPLPPQGRAALYWEYLETANASFLDNAEEWETRLNQCGSSLDATWSATDSQKRSLLKAFRHAAPELVNTLISRRTRTCPGIRKISTDAALPPDSFETAFDLLVDILENSRLETVIFGHLGDFHLHINILPRTEGELADATTSYRRLMETVIAHGGTISAEHGIGKLKKAYLEKMYGAAPIAEMKRIKQTLDPGGLLNPENLFL